MRNLKKPDKNELIYKTEIDSQKQKMAQAYGVLVSEQGIKPMPSAEVQCPNYWNFHIFQ